MRLNIKKEKPDCMVGITTINSPMTWGQGLYNEKVCILHLIYYLLVLLPEKTLDLGKDLRSPNDNIADTWPTRRGRSSSPSTPISDCEGSVPVTPHWAGVNCTTQSDNCSAFLGLPSRSHGPRGSHPRGAGSRSRTENPRKEYMRRLTYGSWDDDFNFVHAGWNACSGSRRKAPGVLR